MKNIDKSLRRVIVTFISGLAGVFASILLIKILGEGPKAMHTTYSLTRIGQVVGGSTMIGFILLGVMISLFGAAGSFLAEKIK